MASHLKPYRGKKATAESKNIVLKRGEVFFEVPAGGVGTGIGKIKMGDGTTAYSDLPYFASVDDTVVSWTDTADTIDSTNNTNVALLNAFVPTKNVKSLFGTAKQLLVNLDKSVTVLNNNKVPFKFGKDANGNYGYYKDGADTVTPFKSAADVEAAKNDVTLSVNGRTVTASNGKSVSVAFTGSNGVVTVNSGANNGSTTVDIPNGYATSIVVNNANAYNAGLAAGKTTYSSIFGTNDRVGNIGTIQDGVYDKSWVVYTVSGNTYQLFPMQNLTNHYMNSTDTNSGGYTASAMYSFVHNTVLPNLKKSGLNITACDLVSQSVYNDIVSKTGTSSIIAGGEGFWLTDPTDSTDFFCDVGTYGSIGYGASNSHGVRPLITVVK